MAGKKGQIPWNKGKRGVQVAWNKGIQTGKNEEHSERLKKKYAEGWSPRKGRKHSEETKAEMSRIRRGRTSNTGRTHFSKGDNLGEENTNWEEVNMTDVEGYDSLHQWMRKHKGPKPCICSICGFKDENSRRFHWANISREYKRDLDDFTCLCVPCHRKYDKYNLSISDAIVNVR